MIGDDRMFKIHVVCFGIECISVSFVAHLAKYFNRHYIRKTVLLYFALELHGVAVSID